MTLDPTTSVVIVWVLWFLGGPIGAILAAQINSKKYSPFPWIFTLFGGMWSVWHTVFLLSDKGSPFDTPLQFWMQYIGLAFVYLQMLSDESVRKRLMTAVSLIGRL